MLSRFLLAATCAIIATAAAVGESSRPECVTKCWDYTQWVAPHCSGDNQCLCNDSEFQNGVYQCLYSQCMTPQFATALHHTLQFCSEEQHHNQPAPSPGLVQQQPAGQRRIKRDMPTQSVSNSVVQSAVRSAGTQSVSRSAGSASVTRSAGSASVIRSAGTASVTRSAGGAQSVTRSAGAQSVTRSAAPSASVYRSATRSAGSASVYRSATRSAGPSASVLRSATRSAGPSASVLRSVTRSAMPTQSVSASAYNTRASVRGSAMPTLSAAMPMYRRGR